MSGTLYGKAKDQVITKIPFHFSGYFDIYRKLSGQCLKKGSAEEHTLESVLQPLDSMADGAFNSQLETLSECYGLGLYIKQLRHEGNKKYMQPDAAEALRQQEVKTALVWTEQYKAQMKNGTAKLQLTYPDEFFARYMGARPQQLRPRESRHPRP